MPDTPIDVILIAPNVSEQMGGEAIKALHICLELERQGVAVHQITHARVQPELTASFPAMRVSYVPDTWLLRLLCRLRIFEQPMNMMFLYSAMRHVRELLKASPDAIVHFTSPVSPVLPYPVVPNAPVVVVIGPINGNIHYPPGFRGRESLSYRLRRWLHPAMQTLARVGPAGKRRAQALLVAGGARTAESLRMAGCRDAQFVPSIDSGVLDRLLDEPRVEHTGFNPRFYHNGRLVAHKGTDLIIKSLTRTRHPIRVDIIGRGPELDNLKRLTAQLGLGARVTFIEWVADHRELAAMLRQYRGFVFPSLAEANGIVVQEAMVQGQPVIALDWGGPALLVTPETGILIEPLNEQHVLTQLAAAMDRLAEDPVLAENMSSHARAEAIKRGFLWPAVIRDWRAVYERIHPLLHIST